MASLRLTTALLQAAEHLIWGDDIMNSLLRKMRTRRMSFKVDYGFYNSRSMATDDGRVKLTPRLL